MYQKVETFSGDLVYLLVPHTYSLQMGTTKCRQDYVDPLVIDTVLNSTHYWLRNL